MWKETQGISFVALVQVMVSSIGHQNKNPHKQHKKNTQNSIKLKGFCTAKKKLNELKRQLNDWEKIFVNHVSDKGLISKTEKRALQLNSKKQTT